MYILHYAKFALHNRAIYMELMNTAANNDYV